MICSPALGGLRNPNAEDSLAKPAPLGGSSAKL